MRCVSGNLKQNFNLNSDVMAGGEAICIKYLNEQLLRKTIILKSFVKIAKERQFLYIFYCRSRYTTIKMNLKNEQIKELLVVQGFARSKTLKFWNISFVFDSKNMNHSNSPLRASKLLPAAGSVNPRYRHARWQDRRICAQRRFAHIVSATNAIPYGTKYRK